MTVMPFGDHLEELRRRLVLAMLGILPLMVVCLIFGGPLMKFLMIPLLDALRVADQPPQLLATSPIETFAAYLKVSMIVAILVATPWIIYQVWAFVAPGLYAQERRFVYFLIPMSALLTAAGMVFLYKVLLPVSLTFLIFFGTALVDTSTPQVELPPDTVLPSVPVLDGDLDPAGLHEGAMWVNSQRSELRIVGSDGTIRGLRLSGQGAISQHYRIGDYVGLVFTLGLVFAVAFQLPLVLMLLSWAGILEASDLTPYRRHAGLACAILGAVFTPQDPGSMLALGGALYLLFEFGLILMRFVPARVVAEGFGADKRKTDADQGDE